MAALPIIVDCEASGPCPGHGSLVSFGAVVLEPVLGRIYRSPTLVPDCDRFVPEAYAAIGMTRAQHEAEGTCTIPQAMRDFAAWLEGLGAERVVLWSDNPAFDWQWINHGFAEAGIRNPFGYSARRIGDLYAGLKRSPSNSQGWKKHRKTAHDHDPLNDALGNAEAMLAILEQNNLTDWLK